MRYNNLETGVLTCINKEVRKVKATGKLGYYRITYVTLSDGVNEYEVQQMFIPYKIGKEYFVYFNNGKPFRKNDRRVTNIVSNILLILFIISILVQIFS